MNNEKIKKIGILTWFHWNNYGTVLQAYALNAYLNQIGYDTETIKFVPDYTKADLPLNQSIIVKIKKLLNRQYIAEKKENVGFEEDNSEGRIQQFSCFREKNIRFSGTVSEENYKKIMNDYDFVIMGSDQIWHPAFFKRIYFGKGINRHKLVAYAPSMGSIEDFESSPQKNEMLRLIKRIPYVAMRENKIGEHLSVKYGIHTTTVVDPTFLLTPEQWENVMDITTRNKYKEKKYLCLYLLERYNRQSKIEYAYQLSMKLHLQLIIIPVFENDYSCNFGEIVDSCGPAEFLAIIENASVVVTDSFHGLAFCGIFEKRFLALERNSIVGNNQQNERIYNILNYYNADNCICKYEIREDIDTLEKTVYEKNYLNMINRITDSKEYLHTVI